VSKPRYIVALNGTGDPNCMGDSLCDALWWVKPRYIILDRTGESNWMSDSPCDAKWWAKHGCTVYERWASQSR